MTPERRSEIWLNNIESKDCGVIAIQAITCLPRSEAELLARAFGYNPSSGIHPRGVEEALEANGYDIVTANYEGHTAATFALTHEYGVYTVHVDGHVMALVEGDLHNAKTNKFWHMPVIDASRITATHMTPAFMKGWA